MKDFDFYFDFYSYQSIKEVSISNINKQLSLKITLSRLRDAVAVSTLIGLSWVFGFFALGEATFAINVIFTVCNSFQVGFEQNKYETIVEINPHYPATVTIPNSC